MSRIITYEEKRFIQDMVAEKWTSKRIAEHLGISPKTVNKWRQYIKKNGLTPTQLGRPVHGVLSSYPQALKAKIKELRVQNAGWGSISIWVELQTVYHYEPSDSKPKFLITQVLSFFPATALLFGHVARAMLPHNAL